jgi:hypothetical protein
MKHFLFKGRTGTMISCYLIHSMLFNDPFEAMNEFDGKRTKDQKVGSCLKFIFRYR